MSRGGFPEAKFLICREISKKYLYSHRGEAHLLKIRLGYGTFKKCILRGSFNHFYWLPNASEQPGFQSET